MRDSVAIEQKGIILGVSFDIDVFPGENLSAKLQELLVESVRNLFKETFFRPVVSYEELTQELNDSYDSFKRDTTFRRFNYRNFLM